MAKKEGRRISAATRAKLEEAIGHAKASIACIQNILTADDEILEEQARAALAVDWDWAKWLRQN